MMQTDLRDILHLRKNLLKAVLNHLDWKVCFSLNCDLKKYFILHYVYTIRKIYNLEETTCITQ